jgi:hypothetical protein
MGLRVTSEEERLGLDLSQHSESAYVLANDYDEAMPRFATPTHGPARKPVLEEN